MTIERDRNSFGALSITRRSLSATARLRGLLSLLAAGLMAGTMPSLAAEVADPAVVGLEHSLTELGKGDQVKMDVYGQPDMGGVFYVGDDGTVSLPLVGRVPVAGLSPIQAGDRIAKALKDSQILVDPHVTLIVVASPKQRVLVTGEISKKGEYSIDPNTTVLDLLAQAGGITEKGADVIYVYRKDGHGGVVTHEVSMTTTPDQKGFPALEMLQGGDVVMVPAAQKYYVDGQVTNPNEYRIESGLTVRQAITRAGGITPRGSEHRIVIQHGKDAPWQKAKPDDIVQPGDNIRVKERIF